MNELRIFNYQDNEVRTVQVNGEPWFVLKDVCNVLGIRKYRDVSDRIDGDERGPVRVDTLGGTQEMVAVNESGLYNVILRSDKPAAKPFRKWVTSEVLPSIRKHGLYAMDELLENPDLAISALQRLKEEREKCKALEAENESMKPKALFADAVTASKNSILIGELAKLLKQNGVEMGQNRLFAWMRENGFLIRRKGTDFNMPTQRAMEKGLFEIKETVIAHSDGHTSINKTPKVTGKGQQYFACLFLEFKESEAVAH